MAKEGHTVITLNMTLVESEYINSLFMRQVAALEIWEIIRSCWKSGEVPLPFYIPFFIMFLIPAFVKKLISFVLKILGQRRLS